MKNYEIEEACDLLHDPKGFNLACANIVEDVNDADEGFISFSHLGLEYNFYELDYLKDFLKREAALKALLGV